jgi:nucleoside-diphosphate-sugar epimerase
MNSLITGAFGFVGTNLSSALAAAGKHRLTALDLTEPENHRCNDFVSWDELHTFGKKKTPSIRKKNFDTVPNIIKFEIKKCRQLS